MLVTGLDDDHMPYICPMLVQLISTAADDTSLVLMNLVYLGKLEQVL